MSKRTKEPETYGPAALVQVSMPFWQAILETDTPDFVFQPIKAMALGQIQAAALINKRCLAYLELPQKLAACRSPDEFMQVNQTFFQTAMRDYSHAVQDMTIAWDNAGVMQSDGQTQTMVSHDYLRLPGLGPEDDETVNEDAAETQNSTSATAQKGAHSNGVISRFGA